MKTIRQFIIFLLGAGAGLCLFSLVVPFGRRTDSPAPVVHEAAVQAAPTPPPARRASPHHRRGHGRTHSARRFRPTGSETAEVRMPARHRRRKSRAHSATLDTTLLAGNRRAPAPPDPPATLAPVAAAPKVPPTPIVFKSIGYAEEGNGQLVAFIMQEDRVQVVHIGDRISDRYRVMGISQEAVSAVDEPEQVAKATPLPSPKSEASTVLVSQMSGDPVAAEHHRGNRAESDDIMSVQRLSNSIGYVQESDGGVEGVVAAGDSVRLVPVRHGEVVAASHPAATLRASLQTAPVGAAPAAKAPATEQDSRERIPPVPFHQPMHATIFRQVEYDDSSPFDDESIPHESAVFPVRDLRP